MTSEHSKRKALPWIKHANTHSPPHLDTPAHRNPLLGTLEKNLLQPYNVILSFLPSILLNILSKLKLYSEGKYTCNSNTPNLL